MLLQDLILDRGVGAVFFHLNFPQRVYFHPVRIFKMKVFERVLE